MEIKIIRNAVPHEFADKRNHITSNFNYRTFNPKTDELSTELLESRIIGGYFNCISIDGLNYWIMYSFFYTDKQLDKIKNNLNLIFN